MFSKLFLAIIEIYSQILCIRMIKKVRKNKLIVIIGKIKISIVNKECLSGET